MENTPLPSPDAVPTAEQYKKLRMLVHASAISLLILAGTVFVFLYRQVANIRNSTRELENYIVEYQNSNASEFIAEAHRRFNEFRQQHPDFNPIYLRYFGTNPPPPRVAPAPDPTSKIAPLPMTNSP